MDLYGEFLEKLQKSLRDNRKMNLKNFVDEDLAKLYHDILMEHQSQNEDQHFPLDLKDILSELNNETIKKDLTINHYFGHVYVLNLDRRPDRLEKMRKLLNSLGIYNWTRFKALDGKAAPHYDEWSNYRRSRMTYNERRRYHRKAIGAPGSWAILKSMYLMIKDAMKHKYQSILVLQDDLIALKNFREEFLKIPKAVPRNWKLLYLGATQHNWNYVKTRPNYYFPMGTADGAFAVGIHHSLYREMLEEIIKFDMPVDSGTLKTLQKRYGMQCMVLQPNLLIADIRDSDLRKSRDLDAFGKKFRWEIRKYHLPKEIPPVSGERLQKPLKTIPSRRVRRV